MTCRSACTALATVFCAVTPAALSFAQEAPPSAAPASTTSVRSGQQTATTPASRRAAATAPQGFSVVLVLGDIQAAPPSDDVPVAARKALADMRDFLPFKSYRLLDAAWLMCCGSIARPSATSGRQAAQGGGPSAVSQILRGPEDQEYELKLTTSGAENSRVFVRFTLFGSSAPAEAAPDGTTTAMRNARRIADLTDKRAVLAKQVQDTKRRVEVGITPPADLAKEELELRTITRELEYLTALASTRGGGRPSARGSVEHSPRHSIMDTSFTMDLGETVVVGTSRLKGGTKALIALLTAVPPRK